MVADLSPTGDRQGGRPASAALSDPKHDPAGLLAQMVAQTPYESIPAPIIELAKQAILDTVAAIIAGSSWEISPAIAAQVAEWGGKPESPVLIYGHRVPAHLAAFSNGVMARAMDLGDVHETTGHVSEWNIPAMMAAVAASDRPISGRDFLVAYVTSSELGVRVASAVNVPANATRGMPGEFQGSLSAAAAVARLGRLSADDTWNALGICYSNHSLSEMQKYSEDTQMVRIQHGFTSETGVRAVQLTRLGVTAPRGIFTTSPGGMFAHINVETLNPELLTRDLGTSWLYSEGLSFKPYMGCKFAHSFIACTLEMMQQNGIVPAEIEAIEAVGSLAARLCTAPTATRWNPVTTTECLFSAPYMMATAVLEGDVFIPDFAAAERDRADKRELMGRISITHDPAMSDPFERYRISMRLRDGRIVNHLAPYVRGHRENRMDWSDLELKFQKCLPYAAVPIGTEQSERIVTLCKTMDTVPDMKVLVQALIP